MAQPGGTLKDEKNGRFVEGMDTSWREPFLAFLRVYPYIGKAAESVGVCRQTVLYQRNHDPEFDAAVRHAIEVEAVEHMKYVGHKKALESSPFLLYKFLVHMDKDFRDTVSTRKVEQTLNVKVDAGLLNRLPPELLQMIVDNKINEAQLIQILNEEKYRHLLPASPEEGAIEMEASDGSKGVFEVRADSDGGDDDGDE